MAFDPGQARQEEANDSIIVIARRTRVITMQSIVAGLGLSGAAMFAAAFGFLTPVAGALLQEAIDIAVIVNALRALGDGERRVSMSAAMILRGAHS